MLLAECFIISIIFVSMDKIEQTSKRTHSPQGEYAATDENYARLLARLHEDRPVRASASLWTRKWVAAASIAIVCGLGWAAVSHVISSEESSEKSARMAQEQAQNLGSMTFVDVPMIDILTEVCQRHSVSLVVEDSIAGEMHVTAEFAADESLDDILEALGMVSGATLDYSNGQIILH